MNDFYEDDEEFWEAADETGDGCLSTFLSFFLLTAFLGSMISLILFWRVNALSNNPEDGLRSSVNEQNAKYPDLAPFFTPEVHYWGKQIVDWANQVGLDPNMVATVMQIESCGNPYALSSAGAAGLFQVMPFHFEPGESPYIPDTNALRGLTYLKRSLDAANGDYRLAFAGYNGGISVIPKSETAWAEETRRYVYWGSGIYVDALQGKISSPRLDEWFVQRGVSLCEQARSRQ